MIEQIRNRGQLCEDGVIECVRCVHVTTRSCSRHLTVFDDLAARTDSDRV